LNLLNLTFSSLNIFDIEASKRALHVLLNSRITCRIQEAELESRGYATWVKARAAKDWSMFAPVLKEWVAARKERAALIDSSKPPYDVLADDYSAGLTAARLEEIFSSVKAALVPLLADLRTRGTPPQDASWLSGKGFDTDKQAALCKQVAVELGFDLEKGRLDVSVHPFTGGTHPTDVRMVRNICFLRTERFPGFLMRPFFNMLCCFPFFDPLSKLSLFSGIIF
jgi:Zn-dependent M32 family carboxypeptidase